MPIHVETKYIAPTDPALPALAIQATHLIDSYMIWIGLTDVPEENVQLAPLRGSLVKDWACAMPPSSAMVPAAATSLFVSSSSADLSLAMAQRLALRFKKQIFLSVDVPLSSMTMGDGPRLMLAVEKGVVDYLKSVEMNRP